MRRASDPVANFRFVLELGFLQAASFSECTGLQLETKVYEYREGGRNSHALKFPDAGSVGSITLKRGVTSGANSDLLYRWQQDVMSGSFNAASNLNRRPSNPDQDIDNKVAVILLDEMGRPLKRWQLFRPFPVKWTGPDLKAGASEVAIEAIELACEGIELA
ncbi:phage tail protein [Bradyrhizobium sp. HKCCYLS20291]|uniref:phage tail protein n=1 Tax=Bradyrhizobium sp. HKCCYLS20291 TaxID=3420766 RepID=UPI003EBA7897